MLKTPLLFKKFATFKGKQLENFGEKESKTFSILFLYEHRHIG